MRPTNERGSVLAQVLIAVLFISIVSAAVLRARLQPTLNAANDTFRVGDDLAARAALNRVADSWTRLGSCASDASSGVACFGVGCSCRCVVGSVLVTAAPQGGACALKVAAQ